MTREGDLARALGSETPAHERGRMTSLRRRAVAYLPAYVAPALMGVMVVPVLTRTLGPVQFGVYGVCLSLLTCLLAIGAEPSTGALTRFYAMTSGLTARRALCKSLLGLTVALSLVVMIAALGAIVMVEIVAGLGSWGPALAVTAAATAAFTVVQYLLVVRYVEERAVAMSAGQVSHAVGKALALVCGAIIFGTAAGSLFFYTLFCIALVVALLRRVVRPRGPYLDASLWRRALSYGVPLVAVSLATVALASFDRAILAAVEGEYVAGVYVAAYLVAEGVVSLPALLLRAVIFTSVLEAYERGDYRRARWLIARAGDAVLLAAAPAVVAFALAGGAIIAAVGGGEYRVPDLVPALVAAGLVAYRMGSLDSIGFHLRLSSGGLARTFAWAVALAVPLTVGLIRLWGLEGAAWATLAGYVAFYVMTRVRSPMGEITRYPLRRLLCAAVATSAVVLAGIEEGIPGALGLGVPLWLLGAAVAVRS